MSHTGTHDGAQVDRVILISALSHALDITEGQPLGHSVRTAWLGMRIAHSAGWEEAGNDGTLYALLLKDAGCAANAGHVSRLFGADDLQAKGDLKWRNWTRYQDSARYALQNVMPGARPFERLARLAKVALQGVAAQRDMVAIRCNRGADVVRELGWANMAPEAVLHLDEHWDGSGLPDGIQGEAIPRVSRLALLSQQIDIFFSRFGVADTLAMVRRYRGKWFDPDLCDAMLALGNDPAFWAGLNTAGSPSSIADLDPHPRPVRVDGSADLARIARTFAEVVDEKSPWTAQHSVRTSRYAGILARHLGYAEAAASRVETAAFFHDLGKLGVSNLVLDKPGPLDPTERAAIERHVGLTRRILAPITPLRTVTEAAAAHHERLDGSGYDRALHGTGVPADAWIIAASDVFDALTAARPYRRALDPAAALSILAQDSGTRLPAEIVAGASEAFRDLPTTLDVENAVPGRL